MKASNWFDFFIFHISLCCFDILRHSLRLWAHLVFANTTQ